MDFLENIKNAVGSAAQTVVKKSGEVAQYSKIKYSMYDINGDIKNLYSQIGEEVYNSYKNDTPLSEDVKEKCKEIDRLVDQLGALDDQLGTIKASIKCDGCGKNVKTECSYCPYCGEKLATDAKAVFDEDSDVFGSSSDDEFVSTECDSENENHDDYIVGE